MEPETQRSAPSLDASTPPPGGVKPSQIPDLMKIGSAPVNELMDVDTDILEPYVRHPISDILWHFVLLLLILNIINKGRVLLLVVKCAVNGNIMMVRIKNP